MDFRKILLSFIQAPYNDHKAFAPILSTFSAEEKNKVFLALLSSLSKHRRDDIIEYFLQIGVDPNARFPNYGTSPLPHITKRIMTMKVLFKYGADINKQDLEQKNPCIIVAA